MRLAVYTDYVYRRSEDGIFAERAFALFLTKLAESLDGMVILGRLNPEPGQAHYRLTGNVEFVPLPHYPSLARPLEATPSMLRSLGRFWRALDTVDGVWLLGPYLLSSIFVVLAALRRKRIFLGVRQDFPRYVASRHPNSRHLHVAARMLEGIFRALARLYPVIVVGPDLARRYRSSRSVLSISVSLVSDRDIVSLERARERSYEGAELRLLSVGRLDEEKNPVLMLDVLAALLAHDGRWRLIVCGEGPLEERLAAEVSRRGLDEHVDLRGYVPIDGGLGDLYRESHALLHVSFTEGVPQILFEAFAAGLPTVATDVGGVAEAIGDSALLVAPADPVAPAEQLGRIARDPELRERLIASGLALAAEHTTEAECRRIAHFMGVPTRSSNGRASG